jgi:8-oxo-dGTP diphosphatase
MTAAPVDVAVGVLIRDDGRFLLAQRPAGKPMPGYWEFPGGKLEAGESVREALVREFQEELGIQITEAAAWFVREHVYPHATVRLHFWRALRWLGTPRSLEGQALRWEDIACPLVEPWLPGALPLKRWLALPDWYAITDARAWGDERFLSRIDQVLAAGSVRLIQLREPGMEDARLGRLAVELRARCREHGALLLVSSRHQERWWAACDGVHLTERDLAARARRPEVAWCAASCHDAGGLAAAARLGVDFGVLGPVAATPEHGDAALLGWPGFAALAAGAEFPVFALGGLGRADRDRARALGAQGIAAVRASWARTPADG